MPYYDLHPFTSVQATHAQEQVLRLIREKRFFLYDRAAEPKWADDLDYTLDPTIFGEAVALDKLISDLYKDEKNRAVANIYRVEENHGLVHAWLQDGQEIVSSKRIGGGFDICRVYPLSAFAKFAPASLEDLTKRFVKQYMGDKTEDDTAPKTIRSIHDRSRAIASIVWEQLQAVDAANPNNHRCLMLMQSRINMSESDRNDDFAKSRVRDLQDFPYAVGFLFYEYSKVRRIIRHSHVVCSTSRKSHVNVQHWLSADRHEPVISYGATEGYDCKVMFATVL